MQAPTWIPPLPPNWEGRFDPGQRRYFFINHVTRATQWEDPRFTRPAPSPTPTPAPTASSAAASLSPKRTSSRPSSAQNYQMQDLNTKSHSSHSSQAQQESNLSEEVDQALVAKLHREFPKASKELIVDMLASCYNNERQTREQLQSFGFGKEVVSPKKTTEQQPKTQEAPKELSPAEKSRVESQMAALFPSLGEQFIRMSLQVVNHDANKGKILLRNYMEKKASNARDEQTTTQAAATSASSTSSSTTATSSTSVRSFGGDLEPKGLSDLDSNRPQGFTSRAINTPISVASLAVSAGSSGARAASRERSPSHKPQQFTSAKQVTKMSEHLLNTTSTLLNHLTSTAAPCCAKDDKNGGGDADSSREWSRVTLPKKEVVTRQPRQPAQRPSPAQGHQASGASHAVGPDPSLRRGPDPTLLSTEASEANGPDSSLRNGPDRCLCTGPDPTRVSGPTTALGPDRSIRCGPQAALRQSSHPIMITDI